jgi:AraC-like DNA-binding protein
MCRPAWGRARIEAQRLTEYARLRRVRDRLDREHTRPPDVEALARAAGMTPALLSSGFREAYGMTPDAYVRARREAERETHDHDRGNGMTGTAASTTTAEAPPRDLATRLKDTRTRLEQDVDVWVSTSGAGRGAGTHLIPLSFLWDGEAFLIATRGDSVTALNLLADGRVRLGLGLTRDVVMADGTAEPVGLAELPEGTGARFAAKTGFDPGAQEEAYRYFRIVPRRVQAWREANELRGRTLMRDGLWLG